MNHYVCMCMSSFKTWTIAGPFPEESRGKCSDIVKKLAAFRCGKNASRDFYKYVKLPLAPELHYSENLLGGLKPM